MGYKMLEVCIDSLESAINAMHGGADELEVCSSLSEGGLTPSAGLVKVIIDMANNIALNEPIYTTCHKCNCKNLVQRPKINVMIRCRPGFDFCYSKKEVETMIADINIFKLMGVDRFVFGALTNDWEVDEEVCRQIVYHAQPTPLTFHRAFDVVKEPEEAIVTIINLGFNRLLTSGQRTSADEVEAIQLIHSLVTNYGNSIQVMPGAGISTTNVNTFIQLGCEIVHASCKVMANLPKVENNLCLGSSYTEKTFITDENIVKHVKEAINS